MSVQTKEAHILSRVQLKTFKTWQEWSEKHQNLIAKGEKTQIYESDLIGLLHYIFSVVTKLTPLESAERLRILISYSRGYFDPSLLSVEGGREVYPSYREPHEARRIIKKSWAMLCDHIFKPFVNLDPSQVNEEVESVVAALRQDSVIEDILYFFCDWIPMGSTFMDKDKSRREGYTKEFIKFLFFSYLSAHIGWPQNQLYKEDFSSVDPKILWKAVFRVYPLLISDLLSNGRWVFVDESDITALAELFKLDKVKILNRDQALAFSLISLVKTKM